MTIQRYREVLTQTGRSFSDFKATARENYFSAGIRLPQAPEYCVLYETTPAGHDNYLVAVSEDSEAEQMLRHTFNMNFEVVGGARGDFPRV